MYEKCCQGYTLLSVEPHRALPGQTTPLIDMTGNVVHEWPIFGMPSKMLPGGSLLAGKLGRRETQPSSGETAVEGQRRAPPSPTIAVVQIGWDGEEEWSFRNWEQTESGIMIARQHHDYQREGNPVGYYAPGQDFVEHGKTLILANQNKHVPDISEIELIDDVIYEADWDGNLTGFEWHAADHFSEYGFDTSAREAIQQGRRGRPDGGRPERGRARAFDWLHLNSISLLGKNAWHDERGDRRFHPENIIISSRAANVVAIISRATGNIVWKVGPDFSKGTREQKLGQFVGQHHSHMIPQGLPGEGNILVFDNGGTSGYGGATGYPRYERDYSRVIEFNPLTLTIVWEYVAENFFSHFISSAQRLPNGNTLITEGAKGHIFEVTSNKETVWEFVSPYRGTTGVAEVYRAYRVPPEWVPNNPAGYPEWSETFT